MASKKTKSAAQSGFNRSIRFPTAVLEKLKAQAKREERTVNWLVNRAVRRDLTKAGCFSA